jgi:alpha/beta superfamily hydrolase
VLRFNFRGVGASEGKHVGTRGPGGEEDDLAAALDHLAQLYPAAELWAGGFSFGSRTAVGLALRDGRIRRLILIALPVRTFDTSPLETLELPGLIVMGGRDDFGTLADLQERLPILVRSTDAQEIADADHFFRDHTRELSERIRTYAARQLELRP